MREAVYLIAYAASRVKVFAWCSMRHPHRLTWPRSFGGRNRGGFDGDFGPRHCIGCCPCWHCASLNCNDDLMKWHSERDKRRHA